MWQLILPLNTTNTYLVNLHAIKFNHQAKLNCIMSSQTNHKQGTKLELNHSTPTQIQVFKWFIWSQKGSERKSGIKYRNQTWKNSSSTQSMRSRTHTNAIFSNAEMTYESDCICLFLRLYQITVTEVQHKIWRHMSASALLKHFFICEGP